uniref:4Fe-4S ferredoxin n=1 Tax=Thermofilum adornatum TaxID=1365176 RepID=A0A7C1GJY9_9CREN
MSLTYRRLTEFNVAGRELREKRRLLVYGSCIFNEYPEILSRFSEGRVALGVCLEAEHLNVVALKLASIFARVDLEEVVVLTVDGSPHCIQLHHAVEEARKVTGRQVNVRHFVIEGGEAIEVSPEAVKVARYLSKIQRLLNKT